MHDIMFLVSWQAMRLTGTFQVTFAAWSQKREAKKLSDAMVKQLSRTQSSTDDDLEMGHPNETQPLTDGNIEMADSNQERPTTNYDIEMGHPNQTQPPACDEAGMANSIQEAMAYFEHNPWTITHSFYAVMGGYAIDTSVVPENQKFLPGRRDRLALTPAGLQFLAEQRPDLIPRVSKAEIQDKSKADTFAKSIVTVQAIFFIIQCLYRLIQHLSISLLELNTFAHTLCALISYAFWWEKPLEVAEPTLISVGESPELWAALCFHSKLCRGHTRDSSFLQPVTPEDQAVDQLENTDAELHLRSGETLGNSKCFRPPEPSERRYKSQEYWIYTLRDRLRWSLVSCVNGSSSDLTLESHTRNAAVRLPEDTLADRTSNWPSGINDRLFDFASSNDDVPKEVLLAFTLAGLSYGVLHLLAWKYPFASHAEHLLWQISGVTIGVSGPAIFLLNLYLFLVVQVFMLFDNLHLDDFLSAIFWCFLGAYGLLFAFSRIYLIVESFISFAYLPNSAFEQPQWTYYFPHIG